MRVLVLVLLLFAPAAEVLACSNDSLVEEGERQFRSRYADRETKAREPQPAASSLVRTRVRDGAEAGFGCVLLGVGLLVVRRRRATV